MSQSWARIGRGGIGRATLSSALATTCDYLLFSLALALGSAAATATLLGCAVGAVVNFTLNRVWAFDGRSPWFRSVLRYAAVSSTSAFGNAAIVAMATRGVGWSASLAWAVARSVVFLGLTYPLFRGWVFVGQGTVKTRANVDDSSTAEAAPQF